LFAKRFKKIAERHAEVTAETPTCLIIDDTVITKCGRTIEFIGKVFDHVIKRQLLGFKLLLLAYWDGSSLMPLDFSYHSEQGNNKKYPFGLLKRHLRKRFTKKRGHDTAGNQRTQEVLVDKVTNAIKLIKRAVKQGFVPDYVLCDSWFSCEKLIQVIRRLKANLIHFLGLVKMDKRL